MGKGRSTAFSVFPPLFGPYHRTEALAMIYKYGPLSSAVLKKLFGLETARSIRREKPNLAKLVVAKRMNEAAHHGIDIMGLNPAMSSIPEFGALLEALANNYQIRAIPTFPKAEHLAKFESGAYPPLNPDAFFSTTVRTRTLVALHVLGGSYDIGKLQRSVFEMFVSRVRVAIKGLIEEGILMQKGLTIRFNSTLIWLPQLLAFLDALATKMPNVTAHAKSVDLTRKTRKRTSHSHGTKFQLFGSRVNQAILTYLAAFGPSRIMKISAAAGSTNTGAIGPLLEQGLVCKVWDPGAGSRKWSYSLNADHPTYAELRALLRTDAVLEMALPLSRPKKLYDGEDVSEERDLYLPYNLFGVPHKAAVANMVGMLVHTPHEEADASSLARLASEHCYQATMNAMKRLAHLGIVAIRPYRGLKLYRLDESWSAYEEMRNLILAMGRVWNEYAEGGAVEARLFTPHRLARERGRKKGRYVSEESISITG